MTNSQDIDTSKLESIAEEFARQSHTILVLKGENTIIATPDGSLFKNQAGSRALGIRFLFFTFSGSLQLLNALPWFLGTAGSGDTLAGIIGGLLAQGMKPVAAAVWGVYFHAMAGEVVSKEVGEDGAMATDFIERLPGIQRDLRQATSSNQ